MARVPCPGCLKNTQLTGARAPINHRRHDAGQHQTPQSAKSLHGWLGFDEVGDEVFRDLVIARIVEPTSKVDALRVLGDLGAPLVSYKTIDRHVRGLQRQCGARCRCREML